MRASETSTAALTNATLPVLADLARLGVGDAIRNDTQLARGVNVIDGRVVNRAVADAIGRTCDDLDAVLGDAR